MLTWGNFLKIDKHLWLSKSWLREEKTHYILYENWIVLHLNKLESPLPKDALWKVWLKLVQRFWRRGFLIFVNVFYLEKDRALHLNKLKSSSPKDALCQVLLKLTQWFWRRWKCEKFTTTTMTTMTTTTDNGQIKRIRKAHLSLWLRWAKKYWFITHKLR